MISMRWVSGFLMILSCIGRKAVSLFRAGKALGALNSAYPAEGLWRFTINSLVHEREQVVTDVSVTDGTRQDRALTFHTVRDGKICRQTEYWPDPFEAPEWRKQWVVQK